MALTQEQWFDKIKRWHPQGFIEEGSTLEANFQGLAKLLSVQQEDMEATQRQTFLENQTGNLLDTAGGERLVARKEDEVDVPYRNRIRTTGAAVSPDPLQTAINKLLPATAQGVFMENKWYGPHWGVGDMFFGTEKESFVLSKRKFYAWWSLFLPKFLFEASTGDLTVAADDVIFLPRLTVNHNCVVNGTLYAYEIVNNVSIICDNIAPGVIISGAGTTGTNGNGGNIVLLTKTMFYKAITDLIEENKAQGTAYDIYSEEFEP